MMPSLLPCFGSKTSLKLFGAGLDQLRVVDRDLAGIDVSDAVGVLHLRQQVRGVRQLRVVDRLDDAGLVHLVHVGGREALDVARAARQAPLGQHLGAARRVAGLVLHDLIALGLQERVLDVLGEEPGVVAAPGADDDASRPAHRACPRAKRQGRRAGGEAEGLERIASTRCRDVMSVPPLRRRSLARQRPIPRRAASRPRPCRRAPGRAASPRFGNCTTTRSAGDRRTCSSSTAPR